MEVLCIALQIIKYVLEQRNCQMLTFFCITPAKNNKSNDMLLLYVVQYDKNQEDGKMEIKTLLFCENPLFEKGKCDMIADDIRCMMDAG